MMHPEPDETRRILLRALTAGLLAGALPARAGADGKVPRPLPAGQSIYSLRGEVTLNGVAATGQSEIRANDKLTTGPGSQAIFVVGNDAFLLRENSELQLSGQGLLLDGLRLLTGALLSVFGKLGHRIETPTATIAIRGTGLYLEAQPDLSYVCTCYGITEIAALSDADSRVIVESKHHDHPKYVTADGRILPATMINHFDDELMLIETLVGRTTPFGLPDHG